MPHEDIVIQDREELYYLLAEAAEFEHATISTRSRSAAARSTLRQLPMDLGR
jgi:hypothetical protein